MQIDWFTVAAQIVNLLILVYLLKRFLYGPVVRAMDAREKRVTDRLEDAQEREEAANEREQEFEQKSQGLEQRRRDILAEARQEADDRRRELVDEAREEVESQRERWRKELERERETFLRDLRHEAASWVAGGVRRACQDLASVDLEQRMISVFQDRIQKLEEDSREQLAETVRSSEEPLTLVTSFELDESQQEELRDTLEQALDASVELRFAESADLVCGLELRTPSTALSWSIDAFVNDLSATIDEKLRQAERGESGGRGQTEDEVEAQESREEGSEESSEELWEERESTGEQTGE